MAQQTLEGHTIIVTGSGSGIGRSLAQLIAEHGGSVVVSDIAESAHETAELVTSAGGTAEAVVGDISDESVVAALIERATSLGGRLGLVNNAGIMDNYAGAEHTDLDMWNRILRVNLTAPMLLTRAALPVMRAAGGGSIVNVGSSASLRGAAAGAAYTSSKHGLVGLTRNTAYLYGREDIRCNLVAPGGVATNITETSAQGAPDPEHGLAAMGPIHQSALRVAQPEEQAQVVLFLLSDLSSDVNGAIIPVDAGWVAG